MVLCINPNCGKGNPRSAMKDGRSPYCSMCARTWDLNFKELKRNTTPAFVCGDPHCTTTRIKRKQDGIIYCSGCMTTMMRYELILLLVLSHSHCISPKQDTEPEISMHDKCIFAFATPHILERRKGLFLWSQDEYYQEIVNDAEMDEVYFLHSLMDDAEQNFPLADDDEWL